MKLVLHSGGMNFSDSPLDLEFLSLLGKRRDARITYVPADSSHDHLNDDFLEAVEYFETHGISRLDCLPIDIAFTKQQLERALAGDAIYLSGGNTFYFLYHLQKHRLLPRLRAFVKRGGVLAGYSAGSILMTPQIGTAATPKFDRDSNDVQLKDWRAMGLVDFEFYPHYSASEKSDMALARYTRKTKIPLYAVPDGAGIVVNGARVSFVGKVSVFFKGAKFSLA